MSDDGADGDLAALEALLAQYDNDNSAAQRDLDLEKQKQEADDRSNIGKIIIWAFVCLIAAIILFIIVTGLVLLFAEDEQSFPLEPVELMVQVLSSVMLPIVTLVLGYYFAKDK